MAGDAAERLILVSGGQIACAEYGSGEPLVFLHGFLTNGSLWTKVVPLLQPEFRCIVPTLPLGSHELPMSSDADLSPLSLAERVADVMDGFDIDAATVVGCDSGTGIAQTLAAEFPQRVRRLVLTPGDAFENYLPFSYRWLRWSAYVPGLLTGLMQPMRSPFIRRSSLGYGGVARHPIAASVLDDWVRPFLSNAAVRRDTSRFLRGLSKRHSVAIGDRLRRFDRPVLLTWSREDRLFPLKYAKRLAQTIPRSRLEPIGDALTYVPLDQPDLFARSLTRFVEETELAH